MDTSCERYFLSSNSALSLMNFKLKTINYIFFDFLSSALAWTIFNYYRKTQIDILKTGLYSGEVFDRQYFFSVLTLPQWLPSSRAL